MIYPIPPLPFPALDSDRVAGGPANPGGQGSDFLDVLARTMADIEGVQPFRSSAIDPTALPPYLMNFSQTDQKVEEDPMKEVIRFVLKQEGSAYVARDGGKESSKYGILQATARGYGYEGSVKYLTRRGRGSDL